MQNSLQEALAKYFGFSAFRYGQEEIIQSIMNGKDTVVVIPTGGGKSLCYQLPALLSNGTAIVISPLIALMKDQVDSLLRRNYPASFINSTLNYSEIQNRMNAAIRGEYKLLYLTPERLESGQFIDILSNIKLSFLAIDEAHCISEWGHDFRPSYLKIMSSLEALPRIPVIALTATATPEVQEDIAVSLKMVDPNRFIRGFDRPNLSYKTEKCDNKSERISKILKSSKDNCTIIYCGTRKRVEQTAKDLREMKHHILAYHAGLPDDQRKRVQEEFISTPNASIVATNAFGMGIDKSNVRNVIHTDYTGTLEAYYQEAGRAGRDGDPADCYLLFKPADRMLQEYFIKTNFPSYQELRSVYETLYETAQVSIGARSYNPLYLSDNEIGVKASVSSNLVKSSLKLFENAGILYSGMPGGLGQMKITVDKDYLYNYYETLKESEQNVLECLLRYVSGEAFYKPIEFDEARFLSKFMLNESAFSQAIRIFSSAGILHFFPPASAKGIMFALERMNFKNVPMNFEKLDLRRELAYKKLDLVIQYSETTQCKRNFILGYFGETDISGVCGKCDSCKSHSKIDLNYSSKNEYLIDLLLNAVSELGDKFGKNVIIDYLLGKKGKMIQDWKLFKGKFYGEAKDNSKAELLSALEIAEHNGMISIKSGLYPILQITKKGETHLGILPKRLFPKKEEADHNVQSAYKILGDLRKELAQKLSLETRGIVSDRTLRLIARELPLDKASLLAINGVSQAFADNFGTSFLNAIKAMTASEDYPIETVTVSNIRHFELITNEFSRQTSLTNMAKILDMTVPDLAKLIQDILQSGEKLSISHIIQDSDYKEILKIARSKPQIILKDLRASLKKDIDLPILRIALAKARCEINAF
jgi:ATP-dependent DNA helicase RecQ